MPKRLFRETIRLPRRYLVGWIIVASVYTLGLGWLWAAADMRSGQRLFTGAILGATELFLFGGAWLVAMRVVVDENGLSRWVGHRRTRIALRDIARSRIEGSTEPGLDRVVLTLRDGSEYKVATRRASSLLAALGGGIDVDNRT